MKRLLPLLFAFLMFMQPVGAVNVWEKLNQNQTYLLIYIETYVGGAKLTPPLDPFNDSGIWWVVINLPYNSTHYRELQYQGGTWTEDITYFVPKSRWTPRAPFKLSDWNLSKVLREYQWGIKNYLPNVTGKHWYKGYWNSSIVRWELFMNATYLEITLHGPCAGECDEYITFECHRNGSNVTCKWGKPVLETHPGPPINGTIPGMESETTSTTSTTKTNTSSTQTTTSTKKEEKLCGPALIIGLTLIPALKRRKSQ